MAARVDSPMSSSSASSEPIALLASRPSPPPAYRFGRSPCTERDRWVRWGEEAEEGDTWGPMTEFFIRASGLSLGASGVGLVQLRHCEELMVRRSGRQEEGRREAPRQALRGEPNLRVVGRLLHALDNVGRRLRARSKPQLLPSMPSTFRAPCPSAAASPPKGAAKTERGRWSIGGWAKRSAA
jgi:hypothetical protein